LAIFPVETSFDCFIVLECNVKIRSPKLAAGRRQDAVHRGEERLKGTSVVRRGIPRDRIDELIAHPNSGTPRHRQRVACSRQACINLRQPLANRRAIQRNGVDNFVCFDALPGHFAEYDTYLLVGI